MQKWQDLEVPELKAVGDHAVRLSCNYRSSPTIGATARFGCVRRKVRHRRGHVKGKIQRDKWHHRVGNRGGGEAAKQMDSNQNWKVDAVLLQAAERLVPGVEMDQIFQSMSKPSLKSRWTSQTAQNKHKPAGGILDLMHQRSG